MVNPLKCRLPPEGLNSPSEEEEEEEEEVEDVEVH